MLRVGNVFLPIRIWIPLPFDADPDPDTYPTPILHDVGKSEIFWLKLKAMPVYIVLAFSLVP